MNWRQAQQASMQAAASAPKQGGGDPLLGTLGSVAGSAVGGAFGGPLGAQLGGSLGGQLAGTGTIDPSGTALGMATSGAGKDFIKGQANSLIRDPLKARFMAHGGYAEDTVVDGKFTTSHVPTILPPQYKNEGGPAWYDVAGQMAERRKKLTGKTDQQRKANPPKYRADGGKIGHTPGDDGFMSAYKTSSIGPLAGVKYKQTDGKVSQEYEKKFHNPLAAKPSVGGSDK